MLILVGVGVEFFLGCNISALEVMAALYIYYFYRVLFNYHYLILHYFNTLLNLFFFCLLNSPVQITVCFLPPDGPLTIIRTKSNIRFNLKVKYSNTR